MLLAQRWVFGSDFEFCEEALEKIGGLFVFKRANFIGPRVRIALEL